jgi:hypothetical protein
MKGYEITYTEAFWKDLKDVLYNYDFISMNLGDQLLDQIWFAEARISSNPKAFSRISKPGFRRCLLKNFPYKIFFRIDKNTVVFIALIHESRSNKYIRRKLT